MHMYAYLRCLAVYTLCEILSYSIKYNEICDGTLTLCLEYERHFLLPVNALFGTMKHGQNMRTTVCVCVCVRVEVCVRVLTHLTNVLKTNSVSFTVDGKSLFSTRVFLMHISCSFRIVSFCFGGVGGKQIINM